MWVMDEVLKTIEISFEVLKIYEVLKYQIEQYEPVKSTRGCFLSYIKNF